MRFALDALRAMPELDGGTPWVEEGSHIRCGMSEGYYRYRLDALLELIDRALGQGKTLIYS